MSRAPHQCFTLAQKRTFLKWNTNSAATEVESHLASESVSNFPEIFRISRQAGIMKVMRVSKDKDTIQECSEAPSLYSLHQQSRV